jgi:hypothetical protein
MPLCLSHYLIITSVHVRARALFLSGSLFVLVLVNGSRLSFRPLAFSRLSLRGSVSGLSLCGSVFSLLLRGSVPVSRFAARSSASRFAALSPASRFVVRFRYLVLQLGFRSLASRLGLGAKECGAPSLSSRFIIICMTVSNQRP